MNAPQTLDVMEEVLDAMFAPGQYLDPGALWDNLVRQGGYVPEPNDVFAIDDQLFLVYTGLKGLAPLMPSNTATTMFNLLDQAAQDWQDERLTDPSNAPTFGIPAGHRRRRLALNRLSPARQRHESREGISRRRWWWSPASPPPATPPPGGPGTRRPRAHAVASARDPGAFFRRAGTDVQQSRRSSDVEATNASYDGRPDTQPDLDPTANLACEPGEFN